MKYIDIDKMRVVHQADDPHAPIVYVIDSPEHPFELDGLGLDPATTLVTVPVQNWNDALTPWAAPGLYRGEPDFGGQAAITLVELCEEALPTFEQAAGLSPSHRGICGYSLGGLFALYALVRATTFEACACLSGSVWYEGWIDYLRDANVDLNGKFAFLSLGTKEKRAARPILKGVQRNMEECARILEQRGCEVCYQTGPGNHLQHIPERLATGIAALDAFLVT